jgi:hypothetical protein
MNWLWIIKFLGPCLIVAFLSGGVAWKMQGARIATLKAETERIEAQLSACKQANQQNAETIKKCTDETTKANELCGNRIKLKDATINKLRQIDDLKGGSADATDSTGDALLDALNRMQ